MNGINIKNRKYELYSVVKNEKKFKCCKCNKEYDYKQFRVVFQNDDGNKKYSCYRHLISFNLCSKCAQKILDIIRGDKK